MQRLKTKQIKKKQHDVKTKVTTKHGNFILNEKAAIKKR